MAILFAILVQKLPLPRPRVTHELGEAGGRVFYFREDLA